MNFDEELLLKRIGYDIEASLRKMKVVEYLPRTQRDEIAKAVLQLAQEPS